ncbi:MAG: prefoldin subunit alpha [Nanobdellota archaeon]
MTQQELQQKYYEFQMHEEHLKKYKEQYAQIDDQILEIGYLKKSIDDFIKVESEKKILCPLSNGIFVKAKINKPTDFLVNVGENVICSKSPEETKELLDKQKLELEDNKQHISEQLANIEERMNELEKELKNLV